MRANVKSFDEATARIQAMADSVDEAWEASEDDLALGFSASHAETLRYVPEWNRWMFWDGSRWTVEQTVRVFERARSHIRDTVAFLESASKRRIASKAATVSAVERMARGDGRHLATVDQWDGDEWLLNTPDGTIDLRTGDTYSHEPQRYMTKITRVSPGGKCDRWRQFLGEVTDHDVGLIDYLQRLTGYALTGSTREHMFAFFYGTGRNGKGTFLNAVTSILGDYASVAAMETFTEAFGERHPTDLAMLRGARLAVAQETEEGKRWAESRIKTLTGGDPVSARFMRQDFFTYTPQFKLLVAGNHKPHLRNVDEAMRRRLHLVPFTVTIPAADCDIKLADKLQAEWPGILAWMVEGAVSYCQQGLNPPDSVRAATDAYFATQDPLAQWIEDCCEIGPKCWDTPGRLFAEWKKYADEVNEAPGKIRSFGDRLDQSGYKRKRDWRGRIHEGVALKKYDHDA